MSISTASGIHTINSGTTIFGSNINTSTIYLHTITRTSSTVSTRYTDFTNNISVNSSAITSANQWIGRSGTTYGNLQHSFYALGSSFTDAQIETMRELLCKYLNLMP